MEINKIIKKRRLELGLTLKDVANALGIAESTVSRYESSNIQNMGIDKIESLAKVLQCSPAYLMGWEEQSPAETNVPTIMEYYNRLNEIGKTEATKRVRELSYFPQYSAFNTALTNAAHADTVASDEDKKHDEDIMNDNEKWGI